jgi:Predicted transcription factor, homolog of eukaryotic MBF1
MYKENFAPRIRKAREEAGYTQKDIEAILNIKQAKLSKMELGQREPTLETLATLAQFYNVSTDWLLGVVIEKK